MTSTHRPRALGPLAGAGAVLAATVPVVLGLSLWPVVVAASAAVWSAAAPRTGRLTALGLVGTGTPALVLMTLLAARGLDVSVTVCLTAVFVAAGLAAVVTASRRTTPRARPAAPDTAGTDTAALWVPALLGPVTWMAAVVAGTSSGNTGRLTWTMMGDSVTYLLYARDVMENGGVATGPTANPVPLPSALIALSSAAGRGTVPGDELLRHDLVGLLVLWSLLIAATCFTAGLAAAVTISVRHPRLAACAAALGSMLPLTWFAGGVTLEYGFLNVSLALPVLFLAWTVVAQDRRSGTGALLVMMLASTVLLATWTPAAAVPMALGLGIIWRRRAALVSTPGRRAAVGLGLAQGLACMGAVVVPALVGHGSALATDGERYPLSPWIAVAVFAGAAATALVAIRSHDRLGADLGATATALAAAVVGLVLVNVGQPIAWNYYPEKLAWIGCIVAALVLTSTWVRLLAARAGPRAAAAGGAGLTIALVVCFVLAPRADPDHPGANPMTWAMSGSAFEDPAQLDSIIVGSDPKHPRLLWSSGQTGEYLTNFWVMQMLSGYPSEDLPLYRLSYSYRPGDVGDLCDISRLIGSRLTVQTTDPELADTVARRCPHAQPGTVLVVPA